MRRIVLAGMLLAAACGHGQPRADGSTRGAIELNNQISVVFDDPVRKVPFETRDVRLQRATEQLARLVGHRIEFHIDTAVLPQYEESFHDNLIETIEQMAVTIADFKDSCDPLLYGDLMAVLHDVRVRYDASLDRRYGYDSELDLAAKTLRVTMDGARGVFVPGGLLWEELYQAQGKVAVLRYQGKRPADIPPAQHEYYAFYVDKLGASPESIELGMELHGRAGKGELADEVAKLVAERGTRMFHARQPVGSAEHTRVRKAWVPWMQRTAWSLPEHHRDQWVDAAFDPENAAVPELDPMRLGFSIVDRWVTAGRPGPDQHRSPGPTFDQVVCPVDLEHEDHRSNYCRSGFYEHAWSDPKRRRVFIDQLIKRKDPALVRAVTGWLNARHGTEDVLALWDGVAGNDLAWNAVGHELALVDKRDKLDDHLHKMWRKWPERRGTLLFIVAMEVRRMMEYYRTDYWKRFEEDFGTVDAKTFGTFLAHGPRAMATAWIVWPVVESFNRGEPFVRHLDALLDDAHLERDGFDKPVAAVERTIQRMCESRRTSPELKAMAAGLNARTRDNPSQATELARALRLTKC